MTEGSTIGGSTGHFKYNVVSCALYGRSMSVHKFDPSPMHYYLACGGALATEFYYPRAPKIS